MKRVTSRDNSAYRELCDLAGTPRLRRERRLAVLDGVHLIREYAQYFGAQDVELFVRSSSVEHPEIRTLLARRVKHATLLSDRLFDAAATVASPVGVLAVVPVPHIARPPGWGTGFVALVDGVQDPGNLGSILRSAAGAGAREVWVSTGSADPWSPASLRGGMGAQFRIPILDRVDLVEAARGFAGRLLVADPHASESLYRADLSGPIGFVVGSEGRGPSRELMAISHGCLRIPMAGGMESLNAGAAAAVLFYEWRRRLEAQAI